MSACSSDDRLQKIKQNILSINGCKNDTAGMLGELLGYPDVRPVAKRPVTTSGQDGAGRKRVALKELKQPKASKPKANADNLSETEKIKLATEVINASLKALTEAVREQTSSRNSGSKSSDTSQTPQRSKVSGQREGIENVASCARIAFRLLRGNQNSRSGQNEYRIEAGMSALVGKLIALNLNEMASQELCMLLESLTTGRGATKKAVVPGKDFELSQGLVSGGWPDDKVGLGLVISSQLHCLKLLTCAQIRSAKDAVKQIQMEKAHGPYQVILRCLRAGFLTSSEAAKHFRNLAHFLSVIPARDRLIQSTPSPDPEILRVTLALQYQLLSLQILIQASKDADLKIDYLRDIFAPLPIYLRDCGRAAGRIEKSVYSEIRAAVHELITSASAPAEALQAGRSKCYLAILSSKAGRPEAATSFNEAIEEVNRIKMASIEKTILVVEILLDVEESGAPEALSQPLLTTFSTLLHCPLRTKSARLDDLLICVSSLRRKLVEKIRSQPTRAIPQSSTETHLETGMYVTTFSSIASFVLKYLNGIEESTEGEQGCRVEQRLSMVNRIARPTVDAVLLLTRFHIHEDLGCTKAIFEGLRDCAETLCALDEAIKKGQLEKLDDRLAGMHVKISDQLYAITAWPSITGESLAIEALAKSVNVLQSGSADVQVNGHYAEKTSKLIRAYQAADQIEEAWKTLRYLIVYAHETGALDQAIENSKITGKAGGQDNASHHALISRISAAFVRMPSQGSGQTLAQLFHSELGLCNDEGGGFLAQCQMKALADVLQAGGKIDSDMTEPAFEALSSYYPKKKRPVCRLRILTWVLQVAQLWPEVTNQEQIKSCRQEILDFDMKDHSNDGAFAEEVPLLLSQCQISLACSNNGIQMDLLRSALYTWTRVINGDREKLVNVSNSLSLVWTQLVGLADVLYAQDMSSEYLTTLQVLFALGDVGCGVSASQKLGVAIRCARAYIDAGYPEKASKLLTSSIKAQANENLEGVVLAQWANAKATAFLETGDLKDVDQSLNEASRSLDRSTMPTRNYASNGSVVPGKALISGMVLGTISDSYDVKGTAGHALLFARASAKSVTAVWRAAVRKSKMVHLMEERGGSSRASADNTDSEASGQWDRAVVSASASSGILFPTVELIESLSRLARRLADAGLVQEGRQHLRQAERVAKSLKLNRRSKRLALLSATFSNLEADSQTTISEIPALIATLPTNDPLHKEAELDLARTLWLTGESEEAIELLSRVSIQSTTPRKSPNQFDNLESGFKQLKITKTRKPGGRLDLQHPTNNSSIANDTNAIIAVSPVLSRRVQARAKLLELSVGIGEHEPPGLWSLLEQVKPFCKHPEDQLSSAMIEFKLHLNDAFAALALDPVFNSLTDAPLSYPARVSKSATRPIRNQVSKTPSRQRKTTARPNIKAQSKVEETETVIMPASSFSAFQRASQCLKHILEVATTGASTHALHEIAYSLSRVSMYISTAGSDSSAIDLPYELAASLEVGRSSAWLRQCYSKVAEDILSSHEDTDLLKPTFHDLRLTNLTTPSVNSFRDTYVEVLPESWSVVSLSLSSDRRELQISKLKKGRTPFSLSLPLGRNLEGNDEDEFDFPTAKEELLDIVKLANYSAHDSSNMSRKGAKTEWWNTRKALDERLRILLQNVDSVWLAGFSGIFNNQPVAPGAFKAFTARFFKVLDVHLPSRSQRARTLIFEPVALDDQVLELFVALGLPVEEGDLDEPLLDLLAFVVDILQLNGERNAFDEIDFDAMVVSTLDALNHYHHGASKEQLEDAQDTHLILILDKHLHCFPWESLPCMQRMSISRLPSLEMLRARILEQRQSLGWRVDCDLYGLDRKDGAFILNPSGDLVKTEETFEEPLADLPDSWSKLVRRAPEESQLADLLHARSIYIYSGHGSGGQYIRSRTVRKLGRCAVSLLLGCSSATVTEAGQFESYGTPLTYLQGGAPAVVGTLWDVTDRDIDKFSMKMLQSWGLFDGDFPVAVDSNKSKAARGKKKQAGKGGLQRRSVTLDTALMEAREECLMRYLNGAAPVVYGVPVALR